MLNRHSFVGVPKTSRRRHTGARHKAAVTDSATFGITQSEEDLGDLLLEVLPPDGSTIGNMSAREALSRAAEQQISEEEYEAVREKALALVLVVKGRGHGGSIALAEGIEGGSRYEAPAAPACQATLKLNHRFASLIVTSNWCRDRIARFLCLRILSG